ncbi:LOW QUALITY PROTEIN: hypothetical protein Cgig2_024138 [Carnegiea gigantea]|uniref:Uncharacterized protein n=1 Tax=Carnegiea gigantea TaxID=171969 RepID=A0A9Q1JMG6_9CARY|nr:LOW QUALITY PROTEIN: hypothetical protein Cgig2_024138 [Carnegiea gigantea]
MEFHNDGIPVGANGSSFSFFLGNQVKNRTVIPIQVYGWDKIKPEALEHLWRCVHKLKCKYFDNPKLKTKVDQMKNRQKVRKADKVEHKEKYGRECARLDLMLKFHRRTSDKLVNAENLTNNMPTKAAMEKLKNEREQGLNDKTDEQIFQEVLDKDRHAFMLGSCSTCYGTKKRADESIVEAKKDVEEARKESKQNLKRNKPRKKQKKLGKKPRQQDKRGMPKLKQTIRCEEKKMKNMLAEFLRSSTHEVNVPLELLWLREYIATGTLVARSIFAMRLPVANKTISPRAFLWLPFFL